MEWLEFGRWSPEVQQRLALQAERLSVAARPLSPPPPRPESASTRVSELEELLRHSPTSNPWGHPIAEC
jgi:hypothetical protein